MLQPNIELFCCPIARQNIKITLTTSVTNHMRNIDYICSSIIVMYEYYDFIHINVLTWFANIGKNVLLRFANETCKNSVANNWESNI